MQTIQNRDAFTPALSLIDLWRQVWAGGESVDAPRLPDGLSASACEWVDRTQSRYLLSVRSRSLRIVFEIDGWQFKQFCEAVEERAGESLAELVEIIREIAADALAHQQIGKAEINGGFSLGH